MYKRSLMALLACIIAIGIARQPIAAATPEENASPANAARAKTLEEIFVTAQRREERLQDVPISISVQSGEDLDKSTVQGISETLSRVPGVAVSAGYQASGTLLAIRGVTAPSGFNSGSTTVGYYIDSVPFGFVRTAIVPDLNVYDLDRVEVMRGPQGTLYGAGSQSGVVRALTHRADLKEFELKARSSFSQTEAGGDNYRGDAAINVPLIDERAAIRGVVGYQSLSGWLDKPTRKDANDARLRNARLQLRARPVDRLDINLSGWTSRSDIGAPSVSADNRTNPNPDFEDIEDEFDVYGSSITYDFDAFSVAATTGYVKYINDGTLDLTLFGIPNANQRTFLTAKTLSQEVNLSSTLEGPWRWTAGAMYRDGEDRLFITRSTFVLPQDIKFLSRSWAGFGELTRTFFDGRFDITAGLRYFEDDVGTREISRIGFTPPAQFISRDRTFTSTTPRLVLTWRPQDDLMLYASYAEGFRSGFDQLPPVIAAVPSLGPVKPDLLTNYEMGIKGMVGSGMLTYEAAVYYIDWQDIQVPLLVIVDGAARSAAVNGPSASGIGADASLVLNLLNDLELGVSYSWNDLSVDVDVLSGGILLLREGDRPSLSPESTLGAFADYRVPLGSGGFNGLFSVSYNLTSRLQSYSLAAARRSVDRGDPIGIGRATFSVEAPAGWSASIFVDNFADEDGIVLRDPFSPAAQTRVRPRTVGVQFELQF